MNKEHRNRIEKLKQTGKNFLIINSERKDPNFFYYTGMDVDYGVLWIPAKGQTRIMMSSMDAQRYPSIKPVDNIRKELERVMGNKTAHMNFAHITHAQARRLGKIRDGSSILDSIRVIKSSSEISTIRNNALFSEKVLKGVGVLGRRETDVAADINFKFFKAGGIPAYDTIVAGGPNTRSPHHVPTTRKASGIAYIDAGIKRNGYISDVTRTYITQKYTKQLELILESIKAAEDVLGPGAKASDVDAAARKALGRYSKYFVHATGHGIGLEVHESPSISPRSNDVLKEGMVLTIEPGIYTKSYGMRVENDYVITKSGFKRLTKSVN